VRIFLARANLSSMSCSSALVMQFGAVYSLLFGASGRTIVAFLPEDLLREMYEDELDDNGAATRLPAFEDLMDEFAKIRADGYAISSGQRVEGAHAIVAPIFIDARRIVGSIQLRFKGRLSTAQRDRLPCPCQ